MTVKVMNLSAAYQYLYDTRILGGRAATLYSPNKTPQRIAEA